MNNQDFDLLTDEWIPCLNADGQSKPRSIRSALEGASSISAIEHESPVVRIATLRLLLAFCYRVAYANDLPVCSFRKWTELKKQWKDGIPAGAIDQYLDKFNCRDRFRLFDDKYPFFQVAGLKCQGDRQPESAVRLEFEQFAGTPTTLWEHLPQVPTVEKAALYLVTCQAFGASASNTSNATVGELEYSPTGRTFAPAYKGCIVWLEGSNLLDTLMLNLVDYDLAETDLPIWERPLSIHSLRARQPRKAKEGDLDEDGKQIKIGKKLADYRVAVPTGPVQLFTWPSRCVLLSEPKNGAIETVYFTQGLALSDHPVDPMKPYNRKGNPISLQPHKAAWRDLHSLLDVRPNRNRTVLSLAHAARSGVACPRLNVAGIARGDQAAKILLWRHERMPVPAALLGDDNLIERLGGLLQSAEDAASELNNRTRRIARLYLAPEAESPDGRQPDKDEVTRVAESIDPRPAYWARLETHFFALLENLPSDWHSASGEWKPDQQQTATRTWREHVKREAEKALKESIRSLGTTARAIQAVARVRTDFNDDDLKPRPQKATKSKRRQEKQMRLDDRQKTFIGYLRSLAKEDKEDPGALADLRSGLGKEPGEMARVHKHVVPYLPEKSYDDRWYYVIAMLFGLFPEQRGGYSLGAAFRLLRSNSDSMEARFVALLNAHPDDLDDHLRHALSLLKANEQPLDWFRLLDDLLQWDHPERHVQLKWARDFYRKTGEAGSKSNTNNDQTTKQEEENHE